MDHKAEPNTITTVKLKKENYLTWYKDTRDKQKVLTAAL